MTADEKNAVIQECIEALKNEYLDCHSEPGELVPDIAYNAAVGDCVEALQALRTPEAAALTDSLSVLKRKAVMRGESPMSVYPAAPASVPATRPQETKPGVNAPHFLTGMSLAPAAPPVSPEPPPTFALNDSQAACVVREFRAKSHKDHACRFCVGWDTGNDFVCVMHQLEQWLADLRAREGETPK